MAKPQTVQYLKHGKALCGKTFVGFVDTWNWMVNVCLNLRGDGDANGLGVVTVDRSNPDCPVISVLAQNGGGGGEGDGTGVNTLNGGDGDMSIVGGTKINVEKNGNAIKISFDKDKEDDDGEDPCQHNDGGYAEGSHWGYTPGSARDTHSGDPCNHDC